MANGETGYLRESALTTLAGYPQMRAAKPTAYMWERLHREAVRTRHRAGVAAPGGAYRSNADLHDIQAQWLGKPHKRDWDLLRGSGAMPSLYSVHGLGRCLDFTGDLAWIKQVSLDWGLTFPLVHLGDLNHGQHDGQTRGGVGLLTYEFKRLQRYLGVPATGKKSTALSKALAARVAKDRRQGRSLRSHYSFYLDLEAVAHAKAA